MSRREEGLDQNLASLEKYMKLGYLSIFFVFIINQAVAAGDPVLGKSKAIICIGCHGVDGNSSHSIYPKLAAQGEAYLVKQLRDFKHGRRKEEHMSVMVEALNMSDIAHVAAYFSKQKRPQEKTENNNIAGKKIYSSGIRAKKITACAVCHGANGLGKAGAGFPSLAGQHAEYISKTLKEFRSGVRQNDADRIMQNIAVELSDVEIQAVANYLQSL